MSERYAARGDLDPAQLIFQGSTSDLDRYAALLKLDGVIDAASERRTDGDTRVSVTWTASYQPIDVVQCVVVAAFGLVVMLFRNFA